MRMPVQSPSLLAWQPGAQQWSPAWQVVMSVNPHSRLQVAASPVATVCLQGRLGQPVGQLDGGSQVSGNCTTPSPQNPGVSASTPSKGDASVEMPVCESVFRVPGVQATS